MQSGDHFALSKWSDENGWAKELSKSRNKAVQMTTKRRVTSISEKDVEPYPSW